MALSNFIKETENTMGKGSVMTLTDTKPIETDTISTGIKAIDEAIGVGGLPIGKITEVFGAEGTLKTTLCLHTIAEANKQGKMGAFVDAEHALNLDMLKRIGVDTKKIVLSQPDSGEQALEMVELMVKSHEFAVVVVDSVAALTPQAEIDKDMGESVMGVHARLMSQAMRKLTAPVGKSPTAVVFINQTRSKIGFMGGTTTTGGNALKFYASLRLEMKYVGKIVNSSGEKIAGKFKCTVVKNKFAIPYKVVQFESSEYGIDTSNLILEKLLKSGQIEQAGSFYKKDGEVIAQGKQAVKQLIRNGKLV